MVNRWHNELPFTGRKKENNQFTTLKTSNTSQREDKEKVQGSELTFYTTR
jgi:hypothetical protein